VFGGDDDEGVALEALILQFVDYAADLLIHELEFAEKASGWRAENIDVTVAFELLANADGLEVHSEDGGRFDERLAAVIVAVDLIDDTVDLVLVVALDVLDTVGPGVGGGCVGRVG